MLPSVSEIVAQAIEREARDEADRALVQSLALQASAKAIAREAASVFGLPYADVWEAVLAMPHNAVGLFDAPVGWALISEHIAHTLLGEPAFIRPSVH